MKKQMIGIALILLGILVALPVAVGEEGSDIMFFAGAALGVIGLIVVIVFSGKERT